MNVATNTRPELSQDEWALVVQLLERERSELPPEIHHTTSNTMRQHLHERLEMVERLIKCLHPFTGVHV
jgi:hypothetical protein